MGQRHRNTVKKWQSARKQDKTIENLANLMFGNFKALAEQQSISQACINAFTEVLKRHFPDFETDVQVVLDRYMAESEERREKEAIAEAANNPVPSDLPEMSAELAQEIAEHNNAIDLARAMRAETEDDLELDRKGMADEMLHQ